MDNANGTRARDFPLSAALMLAPLADMTKLNMWTPLLSLLGSPSDPIVVNTLWILGTAVQNNPRAQSDVRAPRPKVLTC